MQQHNYSYRSDLKAADLKTKICKVKKGGSVTVNASESIKTSASSGGDVKLWRSNQS